MMNRIFIIVFFIVSSFSCKEEIKGLDKLKTDRELLHKQYVSLKDEIAHLDREIARFDTLKRHVLITTIPVENVKFEHFFEVQGVIKADKNVVLYPEVGGIIKRTLVKEGDRVSKGQVLVDLDIELVELQIKELETSLELSTTTYERQKRLWNQKIGSELQYLQIKNQKETLENKLATLNVQMRKNRIVAPFAGVVDEIWLNEGELISSQSPVIRLINLDEVYINADVSESYLGKISKDTDVEVWFPAYDKTFNGRVDFMGNYINPNNRTFKIQVNIPNKDKLIKPNLMAYVRVKDFEQDDALILPDRLIQEDPSGEKYVYVASQDSGMTTVEKRMIKTGLSYQNRTMVLGGINASTVLVDKGARSIKDGQIVQVVMNELKTNI